jgi:hypothetical protein
MVSVPVPVTVIEVVDAGIALAPVDIAVLSLAVQLKVLVEVNAGKPVTVAVPATKATVP